MLTEFLTLYTIFFSSDFFYEYLLILMALGMVPSVIYVIWIICRGYVK